MPNTANRNYRKPDLSYPPNVPADIVKLADDVDADIAALVSTLLNPTGWTAAAAVASGITSTVAVNRVARIVIVRGIISASFAANSNFTAVVTLPVGFRPSPSGPSLIRYSVGNSPNAGARLQLKSDGTVDLATGSTASTSIDLSVLSPFLAETT